MADENEEKEGTVDDLKGKFGKKGKQTGAGEAGKPADSEKLQAERDKYMAYVNQLPARFVHGATVLKGKDDTDLIVLNDLLGIGNLVLITPKNVSSGLKQQL